MCVCVLCRWVNCRIELTCFRRPSASMACDSATRIRSSASPHRTMSRSRDAPASTACFCRSSARSRLRLAPLQALKANQQKIAHIHPASQEVVSRWWVDQFIHFVHTHTKQECIVRVSLSREAWKFIFYGEPHRERDPRRWHRHPFSTFI